MILKHCVHSYNRGHTSICMQVSHTSPEIVIGEAIDIAVLKGPLVRIAVADRAIISGY